MESSPRDAGEGVGEMRYYTLRPADVGKPWLRILGGTWLVSDFIGRILPQDVGKRVYLVDRSAGDGGFLQVENDEQRDKRAAAEGR